MSYVSSNLMQGEEVVYSANIHWFVYLPGLFLGIAGVVVLFFAVSSGDEAAGLYVLLGIGLAFIGLFKLISAFIYKKTTELAITSKRVVAKTGLIRRDTMELNHSKVESFNVDQSVFGRIFGFGTVVVNGTGGGRNPVPNIDGPLEFRRLAMESIDSLQE